MRDGVFLFASDATSAPAAQRAPPLCSVSPSTPLPVTPGHRRGTAAFLGVRPPPSLPAAEDAPSRCSVCCPFVHLGRRGGATVLGALSPRRRQPQRLRRVARCLLRLRCSFPPPADGAPSRCSVCFPVPARCRRGAGAWLGVLPRPCAPPTERRRMALCATLSLRTGDGAPSRFSACCPFHAHRRWGAIASLGVVPRPCPPLTGRRHVSRCTAPSLPAAGWAPSRCSVCCAVPLRRQRRVATFVCELPARCRPPQVRRRAGRYFFRFRCPFRPATTWALPRSFVLVGLRPCRQLTDRSHLSLRASPSQIAADGAPLRDISVGWCRGDVILCVLVIDRGLAVLARDVGRAQ